MQFVNLTPHQIVLRLPDGQDRVIQPSGTVARRSTVEVPAEPVDGIPAVRREFGPVEGIPDPKPGVLYIVSSLVLDGVVGRADVVAPDTGPSAIRENGQVVAVTRLIRSA